MSSRKFALVKGGKKRLEIVQPVFSNRRIIKLDGKTVGEIPNQKALKAGWVLKDKSGVELSIRQYGGYFNSNRLDVRFNGKPVPGSDSNPNLRLTQTWGTVYFIGVFNILYGIFTIMYPGNVWGFSSSQSAGYTGVVAGIIYLILGFFIQRRSKLALVLAILGLILDTVLLIASFPYLIQNGLYSSYSVGGMVGGFFMRFFLLLFVFQGFGAINELNAQSAASPAQK